MDRVGLGKRAAKAKWRCSGVGRSGSFFVAVSLSVPDQLITALRKCVNRRGSPCEPLTQAVEEKHRGGFVVNRSKQRAGSPTKLPSSLSIEQTVWCTCSVTVLCVDPCWYDAGNKLFSLSYPFCRLSIVFIVQIAIADTDIHSVNAHIYSGVCGFSSAFNLIETFLPWILTFRRKF